MGPQIFISYRRSDSEDATARIHQALATRFGDAQVFLDIAAISPGEKFPERLRDRAGRCAVMLVVIGPKWLSTRLNKPDDWVRNEVAVGLGRGIPVIPVLARQHLDQSVGGLHQAGAQEFIALGLLARADYFTVTRDYPRAQADLTEALDIASRGSMLLHQTDAHLGFTRLHLAQNHPDIARRHLATARALITKTGYHRRDPDLATLESALHPGA